MKMNEKMKEVQRKYREELKKQEFEDDKNYIKETIIVVTINCIVYFLHLHLARFLTKRSLFPISILTGFPHNKCDFFIRTKLFQWAFC